MSRVLVVEDHTSIRELVGAFVRRAGHVVEEASDAEEALEHLDDRLPPDIAVLDVAMPGMNGFDLLVELRRHPGLEDLPAIFLSARVRPEDIAQGTGPGATYVAKPFAAEVLIRSIEQTLQHTSAGIDTHVGDHPVRLMAYAGTDPAGLLHQVVQAERSAGRAGFAGVEVYVYARKLSRLQVLGYAADSVLREIPGRGTVRNVSVRTAEGWVAIPDDLR